MHFFTVKDPQDMDLPAQERVMPQPVPDPELEPLPIKVLELSERRALVSLCMDWPRHTLDDCKAAIKEMDKKHKIKPKVKKNGNFRTMGFSWGVDARFLPGIGFMGSNSRCIFRSVGVSWGVAARKLYSYHLNVTSFPNSLFRSEL